MVKSTTMTRDSLFTSVQDVLLYVGIQSRTGELFLESGNNIGTILLHKGRILQAFSPYSSAIGDLLVEDGLVSEAELMETLQSQKNNSYAPLGSLLLKTGKVTFEVIEMLVHEQIRHAVKEFQSWNNINYSFVEKNIQPFDRIHLNTHEFIQSEMLKAAMGYLSMETPRQASSTSTQA